MKRNLIINFLTLSVTVLLLVFIVMAWYVTNEKVDVTGIVGSTEGDRFSLELEKGEYDKGSWDWQPTKSLAISNMQPGDSFFFRFKITVLKSGKFSTEFSDVESKIDPDIVLSRSGTSGNYQIDLNGSRYATMNALGTEAIIALGEDSEHSENKVLYNYDDSVHEPEIDDYDRFSLGDFKVEDTFMFYDYGIGDSTFLYDNIVSNDDNQYTLVIDREDYERHMISNEYYVKDGDEYVFASGDYSGSITYYSYNMQTETYTQQSDSATLALSYRQSLVNDKYYIRTGSGTNNDPYVYTFATGTFTNNYNYYVLSPSTSIRSIPLVGATTSYQIDELGIKYQYFALEFNDALSSKTYLHQDGKYKTDSNLYQAQILSIKKIGLKQD